MRVFVTGATGFIGSAIVRDLQQAGHQVLGLARSDESAALLDAAGVSVHRGTIEDHDALAKGATECDGVIHTAFIHDFKDHAAASLTDLHAVQTMGRALAGSGKPFVNTTGTMVVAGMQLADGKLATELDAPIQGSPGGSRIASERATIELAHSGVRSSVMRLPPSVHGEGDHGFVPMIIARARANGVSAYVGEGINRWPAVHRNDVARLYRLALESAPAGTILHGVAEEGVPTREIAEVIGKRLGMPVVSKTGDEAREHFAFLAHFFSVDNPVSSQLTRNTFNWAPTQPGLIADIDNAYYFGG